MSERTMDGLAASRARGGTGGEKPKLGPRQVKLARQVYDERGADGKRRYTVAKIASESASPAPPSTVTSQDRARVLTIAEAQIRRGARSYMTPGRSFGSSRPSRLIQALRSRHCEGDVYDDALLGESRHV